MFVFPRGNVGFIELKAPGGKQSAAQEQFEMDATEVGAFYDVCDKLDDVISTLNKWMA